MDNFNVHLLFTSSKALMNFCRSNFCWGCSLQWNVISLLRLFHTLWFVCVKFTKVHLYMCFLQSLMVHVLTNVDRRCIINMSQSYFHHQIEPKEVQPWESDLWDIIIIHRELIRIAGLMLCILNEKSSWHGVNKMSQNKEEYHVRTPWCHTPGTGITSCYVTHVNRNLTLYFGFFKWFLTWSTQPQ